MLKFIFLHFLSAHIIIDFFKEKPNLIKDVCKSIRKKPNLNSEENKIECDNQYLKHFDKDIMNIIKIK